MSLNYLYGSSNGHGGVSKLFNKNNKNGDNTKNNNGMHMYENQSSRRSYSSRVTRRFGLLCFEMLCRYRYHLSLQHDHPNRSQASLYRGKVGRSRLFEFEQRKRECALYYLEEDKQEQNENKNKNRNRNNYNKCDITKKSSLFNGNTKNKVVDKQQNNSSNSNSSRSNNSEQYCRPSRNSTNLHSPWLVLEFALLILEKKPLLLMMTISYGETLFR